MSDFDPRTLRAPVSDVYATVVDWRSSIARAGALLSVAKGWPVNWPARADGWRTVQPRADGGSAWADIDVLHREILDGLQRLKARLPISTLSDGNIALLVDMARHAGLPWDRVLSAERVRRYRPDLEVYLMAARLFGVQTHALRKVAEPPGPTTASTSS